MDNLSILREDAKAIYIGNLNTVEADLKLPKEGKNGSSITWSSSQPYVVNPEGKVIRPHPGTGNRSLVITAHLSHEGQSLDVPFPLTVLARELPWKATKLLPTEINIALDDIGKLHLPGAVVAIKDTGGYSTLPVTWSLPTINTPGTYKLTGVLENSSNLVPEAVVNVHTNNDTPLPTPKLTPFPYKDVDINGGIFAENKQRMLDWLLTVNDDTMLYNFRDAAGLDTKSAATMTGWDAPECLLKGHTTGHYLSSLALASCSSVNEDAYKAKLMYMISGLAKCQQTMDASGKFKPGFLSGYSEDQFDLLQEYVTYPSIWAPYYTLHKIFAGLLDAYELAGINEALEIAEKLGLWVYNRLKACTPDTRRKMWAMYIAGEYGGMNEVMARLYRISPMPEYLEAARFFDNDLLFYPMEKNTNTLPGMHGNQHVPQIVGAVEMYEQSQEKHYYDTAANFWDIVTNRHIYSIGGLGEGEMFRDEYKIASFLTEKTAESCASYNMLKLTSRLFNYTACSKMADYFERTLYNHIAASHDQSGPVGGSSYFMPLLPGGKKGFDSMHNTCCHGTGLESHLRYQEMVYTYENDTLYVNLFVPSTLNWSDKGIKLTQHDTYLTTQTADLSIQGNGTFTLKLRIPGWLDQTPELQIGGTKADYTVIDGYAAITRNFQDGEKISCKMPFNFRFEPSQDDPTIGSILYGPLVMVALSDKEDLLPIGGVVPEKTAEPLKFTCDGYTLVPNYVAWDTNYHAYVKKL